MRLAYVDPQPVPGNLPSSIQALYVVDALAARVDEIILITPQSAVDAESVLGRALHPGVTLSQTPALPRKLRLFSSNKPFLWQAWRKLRQLKPDMVLVRNLKTADYLLRKGLDIPLFFETHEIFARSFEESFDLARPKNQRKLATIEDKEQRVYSRAAGLFVLNRLLQSDLVERYNVRTPVYVVPDGVDLEQAAKIHAIATGAQPYLLYLGSLHPWKGVEVAVRAMRHIDGVKLRVVGGLAERIVELQTLAQGLGVAHKVEFVGYVPPARRFSEIAGASVCLLPLLRTSIGSRFTSPLKLFEYMACGRPIVVSDLPSIREVVEPGVQVIGVEAGSDTALAEAVNRLLSDPALAQRIGDTARERAKDFSWQSRGQSMTAFMDTALEAARMRKPRILHTEWSDGWGGQEIRILAESAAFMERGYDMVIACQPKGQLIAKARERGVPVVPLEIRKGAELGSVFKTLHIIRQRGIDLVHTHSSPDSWKCGLAARIAGIPVVRSRHLSTPISQRRLSYLVYMKVADRVITSGQSIKDAMVEVNQMNPERIVSVPAGIDVDRFRPDIDGLPLRRQLDIAPQEFVVGIVAVLRSWKGHRYLVDAVKMLIDAGRSVKLLIAGAGPQEKNLREMIGGYGLQQSMILLGHRTDVEHCIAAMDCVVLPSTSNEATSQVLPQAMAMRKPVIATDVGSMAEVVIDRQTGLLVPPKDSQALADAIAWYMDHPEEAGSIARQGYDHCQENFTFDGMIERTEAVYRELLWPYPPSVAPSSSAVS